jgi:hypothetical protein
MAYVVRLIFLALTATFVTTSCEVLEDGPRPTPGQPVEIPIRYDAHRFLVQPVSPAGDTLSFIADTGGNFTWIFEERARELGLSEVNYETKGAYSGVSEEFSVIEAPNFREESRLPPPVYQGRHYISVPKEWNYRHGRKYIKALYRGVDGGVLGNSWFATRTWQFDYATQQLVWKEDGALPDGPPGHRVGLTPVHGERGAPKSGLMTLPIVVADDTVTVLLDTGATVVLTESASRKVGDNESTVRAGFHLSPNLYRKWRDEHPEWRRIEGGSEPDGDYDLIRVPEMRVGGHEIGPVWLNEAAMGFDRYNGAQAAMGGAALKYFDAVTVDFKSGVAVFER